jgi:uncharacterized protein (TIGR00369 family)
MNDFQNEAADALFGLPMPMVRAFGLRGVSIGDDRARVRMPFDPTHTNSRGDVHGGALAVLMDCVLSCAVRAHDPRNFGVITIDMSLHFVASSNGELIGSAHCERRGRSLSFARGEVHDPSGLLVALATGTFKLVDRRAAA